MLVAMEYERPYHAQCANLADSLGAMLVSEHDMRVITFQFIKAMSQLQRRIVGVCHNDTHTKNLVIVENSKGHACQVRSASGKWLRHTSPFLLKVLDFDLVTDALGSISTPMGKRLFPDTKGNTMIDFMRFASRAILEVPKEWKHWRAFVRRWLPELFLEGRPNEYLSPNALIPTKQGARYLNMFWGFGMKSALLAMLDDPYFEVFQCS